MVLQEKKCPIKKGEKVNISLSGKMDRLFIEFFNVSKQMKVKILPNNSINNNILPLKIQH